MVLNWSPIYCWTEHAGSASYSSAMKFSPKPAGLYEQLGSADSSLKGHYSSKFTLKNLKKLVLTISDKMELSWAWFAASMVAISHC